MCAGPKFTTTVAVLLSGTACLLGAPAAPRVADALVHLQSTDTTSKGIILRKEPAKAPEVSAPAGTQANEGASGKNAGGTAPVTPSPAAREMELGEVLEKEDRLVDAEKAYAKA